MKFNLFFTITIAQFTFLGYTFGQLIAAPGTIYTLVEQGLFGSDVYIDTIIQKGNFWAFGSFNGSQTNLGIDKGIVITTGTIIDNSNGPQGPNNMSGAGEDNGFPGYDLLSNLVGTSTYNAAVIEIDFIPINDSISYNYIFGSDEYPEYVGAQFNDVFGMFLSGSGIVGYNNLALLPNNSFVSINNVNSNINSSHFIYNGDGNDTLFSTSEYYIQYDGFTTVQTAKSYVQAGEMYKLIIAIADVSDGILDSGLFIEECEDCTGFILV